MSVALDNMQDMLFTFMIDFWKPWSFFLLDFCSTRQGRCDAQYAAQTKSCFFNDNVVTWPSGGHAARRETTQREKGSEEKRDNETVRNAEQLWQLREEHREDGQVQIGTSHHQGTLCHGHWTLGSLLLTTTVRPTNV
jgi:hypothetical protein